MYYILNETVLNKDGSVISVEFFVVNSAGDKVSEAFDTPEAALAELELITKNDLKKTIKGPKQ